VIIAVIVITFSDVKSTDAIGVSVSCPEVNHIMSNTNKNILT